MIDKKKLNLLLSIVIQKQNKQNNKYVFYFSNTNQIRLLNFLWENKIIYGYNITEKNKKCIVFLKNRMHNIIAKRKNTNLNNKSIFKQNIWSKNKLHILLSNKCIMNKQTARVSKIGGYLLYELM